MQDGFSGPVEECCKFLQAFAKISRQNQVALFDNIPYLLDQCCKYPGNSHIQVLWFCIINRNQTWGGIDFFGNALNFCCI